MLFPLQAQFFHDRLNEVLGAFDFACDGLEVERGLGWVAVGDAVDAMLTDENEGVSEGVEGNSQAAAGCAHHEFVLFELVAAVVKNGHIFLSKRIRSLFRFAGAREVGKNISPQRTQSTQRKATEGSEWISVGYEPFSGSRRIALGSRLAITHANDSISQEHHVEIQQQFQRAFAELEIRKQLRAMNGGDGFDCFDRYNDQIFYK